MASTLPTSSGPGEASVTKDWDSFTKPNASGSASNSCEGLNSATSRLPADPNKVCIMVDRRTLVIGAAATVGAAAAVVAVPVALSVVGFGKVGVTAGSTAAAINSSMGATIVKGSLYSLCQHWGAVGLPATLKATAAAGGAGLAGGAAYVGTSAPVQFVASKTVGGVKAVANTIAPAVPAARFVACKMGSCLVGATTLMKARAVAAGTHLGILGSGAPTDGSVKPPAARL
ncbi:interferon alpha-inducible protein 27-like protein 2B isoform X2 [Rhipicephalus sanguineus]|nr:interferon alpha-inducible protein 27-like protein 2B isoform X2 [Rhipicephalus sanguineus]